MKYIDADLLRKEIERHLERATAEQEKFPDMPKYRWYLREGKKELCNDLLDYMYDTLGVEEPITDSLQQEQPEMDLEKEIDACWQNWLSPSNQKEVEGVLPKTEFAMYASHFYELGRQAKPEIFDTMAFQKGVQEGRRLEREEMPKWRNYGPNIIKDPFITDLGSLVVGEKCIRIYELYNLPGFKND